MGPARGLLAVVALVAAAPAAAAPFRIAPPPAWVEPIAADLGRPAAPDATGGLEFLVSDDQLRVGLGPAERYHRVVKRVLSPKGVENGSELRVDFDPAWQELVLHEVTIRRGGARIDALRRRDVKLLQREPELDRRLFDGALTAVLFLRDVRQGDVIETAWTHRGSNPVFGPRLWAGGTLAYGVPVGEIGFRVLAPADRRFSWRTHGLELAPEVRERGAITERRWRRAAVPAVPEEDGLPPGLDPVPWVELSDWGGWDAVVDWALPLYAAPPPSPALRERIAAWRTLPSEAERVRAALRFVQDEIRYLGIELGTSSHRPHPPAEVLARRFGDCKDKSLLLVTLLRGLGVEAAPALVSAAEWGAIERRLPSPAAFDHVIVRAVVDGAERWLEPTRSLERASVADREAPPARRALPIVPGQRGLAEIPEPAPAPLRVESTLRVRRFGRPARLEVTTTHEGLRAVEMRHALADTTPAELQARYLEFYARRDPDIEVAEPLEIEDAPDADRVVVRERYRVPAIAEGDDRDFSADAIRERLRRPETVRRRLPLGLDHPAAVSERVRVELPGPPDLEADVRTVSGKAVRLERRARVEGNAYVVELAWRTLAPAVEPAAVADHVAALREMDDVAFFGLRLAVRKPAAAGAAAERERTPLLVVGALLFGVVAFVGVSAALNGDLRRWWGALANVRRRRAFRAKFREAPGDSPELPLPVRSEAGIPARAAAARCGCGAALLTPTAPPERLLFDGRELLVHPLVCPRCGGIRRVFFEVTG